MNICPLRHTALHSCAIKSGNEAGRDLFVPRPLPLHSCGSGLGKKDEACVDTVARVTSQPKFVQDSSGSTYSSGSTWDDG